MRITGLASGMDTESLIKDMMRAQRLPMDKVLQRKQYMEWQRDDYRTINRQLFDFRNLVSDNMMRSSTFSQKTVSSSNEEAVSVRNINSTSDFAGSVSVQRLAEQATMRSTAKVGSNVVGLTTPIDKSAKLSTLDPALTNPQTITIKSIKEDGTLQTAAEAFTLTFNPAEKSLQNVLDEINKGANVSAFYDSFTGKISVTAKNSGDNSNGNEIELTLSPEMRSFTNINANNTVAAGAGHGTVGVNAQFTFNGLITERPNNTFQINGFELNLKQVTVATVVNFSSATDTDKILESVTKFVDEYNKILADLNGQIREKNYRDFQPLTKEQRADLDEKEIELWDEKAKSGTLRNDSIVSSALSQMRSILNSSVTTASGTMRLSDIGITTSSNYSDNGKLVINADKLKKAISDNPNGIYELFNADGATVAGKGLGRQLRDSLDETRKKIVQKAGSDTAVNNTFSLGRTLNGYDSQISRFEDRLQMVETRYYRQFGAMEAAIQRANQQSAYLMNSFGGGQ